MENITDADCKHMKRVWEDFRIKNCGELDWYIQGDTLLLASVFKSFQSKFIEMYKFDPAHFCQHQDQLGMHVWKR